MLRTLPAILVALCCATARADAPDLSVQPQQAELRGAGASQRLVVTGMRDGREVDVTREAAFVSRHPDVVQVDERGIVTAAGDGVGVVAATWQGGTAEATFRVHRAGELLPVNLELDVIPILTAAGCNAGACHGKARGQNGFQLSLLGFYPDFDYAALVEEARGRRVFPAMPARSLLLTKPTAQVPHGGGRRLEAGGPEYEILRRWIASGMPRKTDADPDLDHITLYPEERVMAAGAAQQLLVTAHYTDGSTRDVTATAAYQSNESAIAGVDEAGLVQAGKLPGEATIMARYMGQIATCDVLIPAAGEVPEDYYAGLPRNNFIDGHVWDKLQRLGITASPPADDATFLRRAYTDIIGRLPTPEEARSFLADERSDKRARLVDHLLEQPEYAAFWANKWSDLLLPNPYRVGIKAVINYDAWIRDSFRRNKPYDQFVRELVTAQGSTWHNGAVTFFRDRRSPDEITTAVSQLFLGIRLECAKCHHHPFEKWGQEHFYGFAAYFARLGHKGRGLSPPISGSEEIIYSGSKGEVKHPLTDEVLPPSPLYGDAPQLADDADRRQALARWLTDDNPFFARVMVNRVWADLMGRGLVEPVDDMRDTNPPSNAPLLDALAEEFRRGRYDVKQLIRTIATSYVYGLSSEPTERNLLDTRNYSRHYRHRLRGETLLDGVCAITGVGEKFAASPPGTRAMELWTRRVDSVFLDTFGRPDPNQDPPCERTGETAVTQTLHLMNAPKLHTKVTASEGRAAQLAGGERTPREIVEELYLLVYSRFPTDEEKQIGVELLDEKPEARRTAVEDLLWALLNTPEFVFQN